VGVFIDYAFHIECSEDELLERMRRLQRKLRRLPFDSVSRVLRVNPAYQPLQLKLLTQHGYELPPAVRRRLRGKLGTDHEELCHLAAPCALMLVPDKLQRKYLQPVLQYAKTTTLWREEELPEKIEVPYSLTFYRRAFVIELASVMLRHGYLIIVQPCEGCETFAIGLTSFRTENTPYWLGSGFTKTQYATRFVEAHESICTALDMAAEEGLLLAANDTCKFYQHRDWSKSADIVNAETTFAQVIGGLLGSGIKEAQKRGVKIEDISDPVTRNYNLVHVQKKGKK
jgi:hypothetical protein